MSKMTVWCKYSFYYSGAVRSLGIPLSANWWARLPLHHRWKAVHCQRTRVNVLNIASLSPWGIGPFHCHISLLRLKIYNSKQFVDIHNASIMPFTLSNLCSFVLVHLCSIISIIFSIYAAPYTHPIPVYVSVLFDANFAVQHIKLEVKS